MTDLAIWTTFGGLLLTGLAGSLHCIGMCGPILAGFSQVFSRDRAVLTVGGREVGGASAMMAAGDKPGGALTHDHQFSLAWDFTWYHVGRLWTYGFLGFLAGLLGLGLRQGSALAGYQHVAGMVIGGLVIVTGLILLGAIPGLRVDGVIGGCGQVIGRFRWLASLQRERGVMARLLLGVVMGFLPCGLVYAALAVAVAMPTPVHAAAGMVVFGIGTLPSLTAVLMTSHLLPTSWRAHGTRIASVFIIATGLWMGLRGYLVWQEACGCHAG